MTTLNPGDWLCANARRGGLQLLNRFWLPFSFAVSDSGKDEIVGRLCATGRPVMYDAERVEGSA
jgi:hypothetical protein